MSSYELEPAEGRARIGLHFIRALAIMGLLISPILIFSLLFIYDAPGSENNIILAYLVAGILVFPVLCVIGIIWASILLRRFDPLQFWLVMSMPFLWLVYMIGVNAWLDNRCDGNFMCQKKAQLAKPSVSP